MYTGFFFFLENDLFEIKMTFLSIFFNHADTVMLFNHFKGCLNNAASASWMTCIKKTQHKLLKP